MQQMPQLSDALVLPCGAVLPNRLCKSAMTEGVADEHLRPTSRHEVLYRQWSEGGCGLLITGNVQIDRRVLERPGNVAIDPAPTDAEMMRRLKAWAKAGTVGGNHLWMQISHAGRQSPMYVTMEPLAPSAVQLKLLANYAKPRALREDEILDFIQRYARVAATAREAGFTGVQIHGAHGYLLSSFLSGVTNLRTDAWGGSLQNRARMLLETIKATRKAVGPDFPISVKLNSADFQKGGFTNEECLQVVEWLNEAGIDLLEVSGGSYEQPRLLGYEGKAKDVAGYRGPDQAEPQKQLESTRKREAYFLEYATAIRRVAKMPMLVTGGFRTREGMDEALRSGDCDVVGLGRPLCGETDLAKRLLDGAIRELPRYEKNMQLGPGIFAPTTKVHLFRLINVFGQQGWYYLQLLRLADGLKPNFKLGVFGAFVGYLTDEYKKAWRMHRARRAAAKAA